jgi:hypothetical protein
MNLTGEDAAFDLRIFQGLKRVGNDPGDPSWAEMIMDDGNLHAFNVLPRGHHAGCPSRF